MEKLYMIAQQFTDPRAVGDIHPYGAGNVNDTYLVTVADTDRTQQDSRFVLQRVNTHIFRQPDLILLNMRTFLTHMAQRSAPQAADGRWEMPHIIPTVTGQDYYVDPAGDFWRAISLIDRAKTYPKIQNPAHARESGSALGRFHRLLSDLNPAHLHDTLPGFHITPQYLAHYDQVLHSETAHTRINGEQATAINQSLHFVEERRSVATVLEEAQAKGDLTLRAIHGDPKVDNILIDDDSGKAVSIIDLDTVKPGLVHYDIGDCLRSCCNPAGEETTALHTVMFDIDLCRTILDGYLKEAAHFFTAADYTYVYDSIHLIAFELGLRFFTDYLGGDVYFKVKHPLHNLQRAQVQFQLVKSIERQEAEIRYIIAAYAKSI